MHFCTKKTTSNRQLNAILIQMGWHLNNKGIAYFQQRKRALYSKGMGPYKVKQVVLPLEEWFLTMKGMALYKVKQLVLLSPGLSPTPH